jgi:hypothetical protein
MASGSYIVFIINCIVYILKFDEIESEITLSKREKLRVCLVELWLWKKLLWTVSCGKSCCGL